MSNASVLVFKSFIKFTKRYPITRGMITYAILWPSSNLFQQLVQGRERLDWKETLRFSIFGTVYVAPTIYAWVRIIGKLAPGNSLRIAVTKACIGQVVFAPFAITGFYYGMGFLEGKNFQEATEEVKQKFLPTYKTGVMVWPIVHTINFAFINERNRVMFNGIVSFFWTVYMSYMKSLEVKPLENSKNEKLC